MNNYYRFNLNFFGDYICDYLEAESDGFMNIKEPTIHFKSPTVQHGITETTDYIWLSKNQIVCYFETSKP